MTGPRSWTAIFLFLISFISIKADNMFNRAAWILLDWFFWTFNLISYGRVFGTVPFGSDITFPQKIPAKVQRVVRRVRDRYVYNLLQCLWDVLRPLPCRLHVAAVYLFERSKGKWTTALLYIILSYLLTSFARSIN